MGIRNLFLAAAFVISSSYAVAEPLLQARGLFLAIKNGTDRLVAGGFRSRCVGIEAELASLGASCQRLPVEVASHTPHMQGASAPFAAALAAYRWREFTTPVLSGIRAEKITGEMQARQTLVEQLTQPVAWESCIDACAENGIGVTLELGPGDALSRMMRARYPEMASRSVADFRSLAAAATWLQRQIES